MNSTSIKVWVLCTTVMEIYHHCTTQSTYRARNSTRQYKTSPFPLRYFFQCFESLAQYHGCEWKITPTTFCRVPRRLSYYLSLFFPFLFSFFLIYAIKLYIIYILFPFKFNTRHGNIFLQYRYFCKNLWVV